MSGENEDDDKQYEPTQKKLDDARKRGEVPRSTDVSTAAVYAGVLLAAVTLGASSVSNIGTAFMVMFENADSLSDEIFRGHIQPVFGGVMSTVVLAVSPWVAIPAALALLSILAQRSLIFAPEKLQMKMNRISILANAKNKFGRNGWFEFAKSLTKLTIYSMILGFFLLARTPEIISTVNLNPMMATQVLAQLCISFMVLVLVVAIVIGAIDMMWQIAEHTRKNRMSRKEMVDESKQNEGDPHIKQQRRQRGYDIAMNRMLSDVPTADVVVVNPEHYAVALKWSRSAGAAPICVAKGVDEVAARIREKAGEAGVPIHRDPPAARAMYAAVEIGQEIRPEHYKAVAAAIRFAETMRAKAKGTTWRK